MRILIIEDEQKLCTILDRGFRAEGFAVDISNDGENGLALAQTYAYDCIILDVQIPKISGTEVLKSIRAVNPQIPVLMLTAMDAVQDKVQHFNAGADDYLTKPFSFAELLVRVRALTRRGQVTRQDKVRIHDLEIDRLAHQVRRSGQRIDLSAKEFALLDYLASNIGRVLSRTMIIEHVWDQTFEGLTNIVDVYIRQLRAKVDDAFEPKLIRTVRGVGYAIEAGHE